MSGIVAQNTLDNTGLIKSPAGGGAWNFISKQTASADATIDFTSGIDSTYKEYLFTFNNIHPATGGVEFGFQANAAGGSGYNETITSSFFTAFFAEADEGATLEYASGQDQAQGTGFQSFQQGDDLGADNDQSHTGYLRIFNPSSTTFVKHFISKSQYAHQADYTANTFCAGYFNTTSAIDEIQFKMTSGNIDAGDICLYGLTT